MADDNQLAKTLQQYLADPKLLTDENVRRFSRSLRDKGRGMKLHRENRSARARLLHETGLKDLVSGAVEDGTSALTLHHVVQLACALGCSLSITVTPHECMEQSIAADIDPAFGLGTVFDGHRDFWASIREAGELVASQEWDSGGPGAGAGVVEVYEYNERFFVFHDAGVSEYETLYEALRENGLRTKGVKKPKPKPKTPPPIFEGSNDDGSWDRADNWDDSDGCGGWS